MFKKLHFSLIVIFISGLFLNTAVAQTGSLSGTVTDANGETLPGANILLQELNRGAATDVDGNYMFQNLTPDTYTLIATFIGYKQFQQQVEINSGANSLDIMLSPDFIGFDEIVVTGVGAETSKKKLGIDVSSVSEEELTKVASYTISGALTGKVAGATIVNGGAPGAPSSIILRGINTMGVSRPMILIDGVEIDASTYSASGDNDRNDRLADLDFSDVERVEVVKGAAAATLYGAQGANGVIQIFTKSGQAGKMQIDASTSWSFDKINENNIVQQNSNFHSFPVDADGNIIGMSFDEENGVWTVPSSEPNGVVNQPYTGYIDEGGNVVPLTIIDNRIAGFYRTGVSQIHDLSISGGNTQTQYLISGNFLDQEGIEDQVGFQRLSFRLNTDTQVRDDLKFSLRTNYVNSGQTGATESGDNIESGLGTLLPSQPFIDISYINENGSFAPKLQAGSVSTNPLFLKDLTSLSTGTDRLIGSANVNYTPLKFLELDYRIGVDYYYSQFDRVQKNAQGFEDPDTAEEEVVILQDDGFVTREGRTNFKFNSILDAIIRTDFQRDFDIDLPIRTTTLLKFDWRRNDFQSTEAEGTGLPFGIDLTTLRATSNPSTDEFKSTFITYGFLVNQKFEIGNILGFSAGIRADKSSAFGKAAEFSYFPRGDVYLRISDLDFWNSLINTVNEFKLRAAYGEAGTQPGAFERFVTLSQGLIGSQGTFNTSNTASNPALLVEISKEFEAGADIGFNLGDQWFQSLGVSGTFWTRENNGTIQSLETAPSIGAGNILNNAINLSSQGVDASLNALVFFNDNWSWFSSINFGKSFTEVEHIANGQDLVLEASNAFRYLFREGERYGIFYGFNPLTAFDEINPQTGEPYIAEADRDNFTMVDGVVVNRFNKQIQFRSELEKIGDPTPDFTLSFRNGFQIKDKLDIAFQLDWVQGKDIFNGTKWWMFNSGVHREFEEEVLIDGGETAGGPMFDANGDPTAQTSRVDGSQPQAWRNYHASKRNEATPFFVEDGSYLKLREVSVSYDFAGLVGYPGIRYLRLGVAGRNLITMTKYSGFDPEVSAENQDARFRGLDIFTYPNYRTFSFNASIGF